VLNGGNLQIHSGSTTGAPKCGSATITTRASEALRPEETIPALKFEARVYPNPTSTQFDLYVASDNINDKVEIKVHDIMGKQIQIMNGAANKTYQFGSNYINGIYFVEVRQGNKTSILKLIKQ